MKITISSNQYQILYCIYNLNFEGLKIWLKVLTVAFSWPIGTKFKL